jgi:predicted TPR repeat methyltransferase
MGQTRSWLAWICVGSAIAAAAPPEPRFLSFSEAQEVLTAFNRTEDAAAWDAWVRTQDREVRARIERGVEDSISNLVIYGTSFTRLPRLDSPEAAVTPAGELVETARARVRVAAAALTRTKANERLQFAREYLARHGVEAKSTEAFLQANLIRFALEQRGYQEKLKSASAASDPRETLAVRATLFDQRGLSVDTSLLPNYALEDTLRAMIRKGALSERRIRNIAVIGPGLDFADKRDGYDFYPVQTIQPFAVLEAVVRLGLDDPAGLRLVTFDLNPAVNVHLRRMAERARAGTPYIIYLPRDTTADWTPQAVAFWEHFGELIGSPAASTTAPKGLSVRTVAVQPKYASRIEPRDLNVVGQVADGEQFDLVVATNILVYYDRFQQALAMASIARMMSPGGVFLSNTVLPAQRPTALEYLGRRSVTYSASGSYGDDVVVYRRR